MMPLAEWHFEIVLVYFVYGLAFFTMGVALTLETGRVPMLAEQKIIRPLALFGVLHGIHEWLEVLILQGIWVSLPFAPTVTWARIVWLAVSFIPLIVFGLRGIYTSRRVTGRLPRLATGFLIAMQVFLLVTAGWSLVTGSGAPLHADVWSRYALAIPGSWLAALALFGMAKNAGVLNRPQLARHFQSAAFAFIFYGFSQAFVPQADIFLANRINATLFLDLLGFPVQVVRAGAAVWATLHLILALQEVERERGIQLVQAQQARLQAMERVQQELAEREAMRHELLRHTVIAQEEERARIARELHDETSQALAAFGLHLAALRDLLPSSARPKEQIAQLQDLNRRVSQGIYRLIHDLRPAQLDDLGLAAALKYLADEERRRSGVEVSVKIDGMQRRLDPLVEVVCFRVAQEALTNIVRHAGVRQAAIQLVYAPQETILRICDEGVGFDVNRSMVPPHGWGLMGMRERAESVGGQLNIDSAPGRGTRIDLCIKDENIAENSKEIADEPNQLDAG